MPATAAATAAPASRRDRNILRFSIGELALSSTRRSPDRATAAAMNPAAAGTEPQPELPPSMMPQISAATVTAARS